MTAASASPPISRVARVDPEAARLASGAWLRPARGEGIPLHVDRWFAPPQDEELRMLARATPPVLDVGCGPARHVLALRAMGVAALGIDNAAGAVGVARRRGASVLQRCVFGDLPAEGRWGSALLLDGNVGIGGEPDRLLARLHRVVRVGGRVLIEVEPPGRGRGQLRVRAELDGRAVSSWFAWATVGADEVPRLARMAGFATIGLREDTGRWFATLEAR
jgi:SAM-dependent methyltransferase